MTFEFEAYAKIILENKLGENFSTMKETLISLNVPENFDESQYLDVNGNPTKEGAKVIISCFTSGINVCLQSAREQSISMIPKCCDML